MATNKNKKMLAVLLSAEEYERFKVDSEKAGYPKRHRGNYIRQMLGFDSVKNGRRQNKSE